MSRELAFETGIENALEENIQSFTLPPAVHVTFTEAQGAFLQNTFKEIRVFYFDVERAATVDLDIGHSQHFSDDAIPLIVLNTYIFYTR
jgi:hypothetical protein